MVCFKILQVKSRVLENRGVFADLFSKGKKRCVNVPLLKRHSRFKHPEHDFAKAALF